MAFLESFVGYIIVMAIIVVVGAIGGFIGVKIRNSKDAKDAAKNTEQKAE